MQTEQLRLVAGHDKLLIWLEDDRLIWPVFDGYGDTAADERRFRCPVGCVGFYIEARAQYPQVHPRRMNDKRLLGVPGHVEKSLARQVDIAATAAVGLVISQAAAGIEPHFGAIGKCQMGPGSIGRNDFVESRRSQVLARVRRTG